MNEELELVPVSVRFTDGGFLHAYASPYYMEDLLTAGYLTCLRYEYLSSDSGAVLDTDHPVYVFKHAMAYITDMANTKESE